MGQDDPVASKDDWVAQAGQRIARNADLIYAMAALIAIAFALGLLLPPSNLRAVVLLLCACGLLGGLANHALAYQDSQRSLSRSLVCGVVAALLIPLFLKLADSQIVPQILNALPSVSGPQHTDDLKQTGVPKDANKFAGELAKGAAASTPPIGTAAGASAPPAKGLTGTGPSAPLVTGTTSTGTPTPPPAPPAPAGNTQPGSSPIKGAPTANPAVGDTQPPAGPNTWLFELLCLIGYALVAATASPTFLLQMQGVLQRSLEQQRTAHDEVVQKRVQQQVSTEQTRLSAAPPIATEGDTKTLAALADADAVLWAFDLDKGTPTAQSVSAFLTTNRKPAMDVSCVATQITNLVSTGLLVGRAGQPGSPSSWMLSEAGRTRLTEAAAQAAHASGA